MGQKTPSPLAKAKNGQDGERHLIHLPPLRIQQRETNIPLTPDFLLRVLPRHPHHRHLPRREILLHLDHLRYGQFEGSPQISLRHSSDVGFDLTPNDFPSGRDSAR